MLQSEGLWSQYLEVGIGPYAEVFTKAQPLLGTLFAPNQDRGSQGKGFTHQLGDIVSISANKMGKLQNRVTYTHLAPPWKLGIMALMQNLSQRRLL